MPSIMLLLLTSSSKFTVQPPQRTLFRSFVAAPTLVENHVTGGRNGKIVFPNSGTFFLYPFFDFEDSKTSLLSHPSVSLWPSILTLLIEEVSGRTAYFSGMRVWRGIGAPCLSSSFRPLLPSTSRAFSATPFLERSKPKPKAKPAPSPPRKDVSYLVREAYLLSY